MRRQATMAAMMLALLTSTVAACVATPVGGAGLAGGEWTVEDIAGRGVVDGAPATLAFAEDGNLSGSTTCNRLIASYTVSGSALSISPAGTTMMACPEALMNQERRLLDALAAVESYRIDETGALILMAAGGTTITARR